MSYIRIFKNGQLIELRAENERIGGIKNFLKKKGTGSTKITF